MNGKPIEEYKGRMGPSLGAMTQCLDETEEEMEERKMGETMHTNAPF